MKEEINHFFISAANFHNNYKVGEDFICATQTYNHIPGQSALVSKDIVVTKMKSYAEKFINKPQCFNETSLFPPSYRLNSKPYYSIHIV